MRDQWDAIDSGAVQASQIGNEAFALGRHGDMAMAMGDGVGILARDQPQVNVGEGMVPRAAATHDNGIGEQGKLLA